MAEPSPQPTPVDAPVPLSQPQPSTRLYPEHAASDADTAKYRRTGPNTSMDWLPKVWVDADTTVELQLDGMTDYAARMKKVYDDVGSCLGHFSDMVELLDHAWTPGAIGEGVLYAALAGHNYQEVMTYLQNLNGGIYNIASAAQAVVDYYGEAEGWSAASLDSVNFAFGDKSVPAPANWAHGDRTWFDLQKLDDGEDSPGNRTSGDDPEEVTTASLSHARTTIASVDGTVTISTTTRSDGSVATTTVVSSEPKPDGSVTTTVTTSYDGDGKKASQVIDAVSTDGTGHITGEQMTTVRFSPKSGEVTSTENLYLGDRTDSAPYEVDIDLKAYESIDANHRLLRIAHERPPGALPDFT